MCKVVLRRPYISSYVDPISNEFICILIVLCFWAWATLLIILQYWWKMSSIFKQTKMRVEWNLYDVPLRERETAALLKTKSSTQTESNNWPRQVCRTITIEKRLFVFVNKKYRSSYFNFFSEWKFLQNQNVGLIQMRERERVDVNMQLRLKHNLRDIKLYLCTMEEGRQLSQSDGADWERELSPGDHVG